MPDPINDDTARPDLGGGNTQGWNWHPDLPIEPLPIFAFPPRPLKFFKWFASAWLSLSPRILTLLMALATWLYLQPALERCRDFELTWIAQIYLRNLLMMIVIAGGLHLYLYTYKRQGKALKFDARDQIHDSRVFTFNNQVRDNIFWSLASGVTIWTAYEVLTMWAFANGHITLLSWQEHPVWFALLFVLIPIWNSMHFYVIHRPLHWPVLYKRVHALHHRNINVGPWAGISMHPFEHLLYYSSILIHWVVASHPLHVIFNLHYQTFNAVYAHSGFENLLIGGKRRLALGSFNHQLHHRYFECNYGNAEMPWDVWAGTFHDGTERARTRIRQQRRKIHSLK